MRLGSELAITGLVLLLFAATQDPVITETTLTCTGSGWSSTCGEYTETRINVRYAIANAVGGFLFVAGSGAWIGTYDTERRAEMEK